MNKRYRAIKSISKKSTTREDFMLNHMEQNKSISSYKNIEEIKERYKWYRKSWKDFADIAYHYKYNSKKLKDLKYPPLCVDLELASVCDLACPFCYRNYIATPDKIMKKELAFKLIDQCKELNVPSMKFNWRGEPLMHPQLSEIIKYAKNSGIIETIINTNATHLNEKVSKKLIDSGLDILIYSFDGGSKKTYEKMRPGRFKDNKFEDVYQNIINFSEIKKKSGSIFPRTQIQMIITKETVNEVKSFFELFSKYVDDVTLKNFTDRGTNIDELSIEEKEKVLNFCQKKNITFQNYLRDSNNNIYISTERLPCEQPLQRMMITYDGIVSMCCYDWGSYHPVGYVDQSGYTNSIEEYHKVKKKSDNLEKGFQMMKLEIPKRLNLPPEKVSTLNQIWYGEELEKIRNFHAIKSLEKVAICKSCPFKETYKWINVQLN